VNNISNYSNINVNTRKASLPQVNNNVKTVRDLEFNNLLQNKIQKSDNDLKISGHAEKRFKQRNINLDSSEFLKIKDAVSKLNAKGGKDSLIITDNAAYIVDVDKKTIVTAVDKNNLNSNVFTNIDSTIFIN
jgi:flagellar operon protein